MKQYVVDELRPQDVVKIREFLEENASPAPLAGLYRVEVPEDMLSNLQEGHDACGPFYFSVNLDERSVKFELLIRCTERIRCTCISYATRRQRDYIIRCAEDMLDILSIIV